MRVLLASEDGFLYMYNLDVTEGGDCQLIRQFRLTDLTPDLAKQEQQNLEKESNPPPQNLQRGGPVDIPDGKTQPRPEGKAPFRFVLPVQSFFCVPFGLHCIFRYSNVIHLITIIIIIKQLLTIL